MDYELIEKARGGDSDATDALLRLYKDKVKKAARGYFLIGGDLDDLAQEGMLGLFKAIGTFDKSRSEDFEAYAMMCVNREIINCVRKNNTYKNKTLNAALPLESAAMNADALSPESVVIGKEQDVLLDGIIDKNLSKLEKKVVSAFTDGFSYDEIAEKNGITVKSVDNALQRARAKLASGVCDAAICLISGSGTPNINL